jgi:hypothetical protein
MNLIQHKIHKRKYLIEIMQQPNNNSYSHSGIRPVVPVFDISLTFFLIVKIYLSQHIFAFFKEKKIPEYFLTK